MPGPFLYIFIPNKMYVEEMYMKKNHKKITHEKKNFFYMRKIYVYPHQKEVTKGPWKGNKIRNSLLNVTLAIREGHPSGTSH